MTTKLEVQTKAHAIGGGTGADTGAAVKPGQLLVVTVDPSETWRAGSGERTSTANEIDSRDIDIHRIAAAGTQGAGQPLPFLDTIQRAFGPDHDLSSVRAHVGGGASDACRQMSVLAYTRGSQIAFAGTPDLHTAAHEAAHVVQQRGGVSLKEGLGRSGDIYERLADAVAEQVVRGASVERLLDMMASLTGQSEPSLLGSDTSPSLTMAVQFKVGALLNKLMEVAPDIAGILKDVLGPLAALFDTGINMEVNSYDPLPVEVFGVYGESMKYLHWVAPGKMHYTISGDDRRLNIIVKDATRWAILQPWKSFGERRPSGDKVNVGVSDQGSMYRKLGAYRIEINPEPSKIVVHYRGVIEHADQLTEQTHYLGNEGIAWRRDVAVFNKFWEVAGRPKS